MGGEHEGKLSRGCEGLMAVSGQCTPGHGDCKCLREADEVGAEHGSSANTDKLTIIFLPVG